MCLKRLGADRSEDSPAVIPSFPLSSFPLKCFSGIAGPEEAKNLAGKSPPPDSDPFDGVQSEKIHAGLSSKLAASANRRFEFYKRRQQFIRTHNETLSVAAMCVSN